MGGKVGGKKSVYDEKPLSLFSNGNGADAKGHAIAFQEAFVYSFNSLVTVEIQAGLKALQRNMPKSLFRPYKKTSSELRNS